MDSIPVLQKCHTSDIIRDSGTSCLVIRKPPLIRFSPFNSQSSLYHGLLQPYSTANTLGWQVNSHLQKKFLQPKLTGQKNIQITFLHGFCNVTCKQPRIATGAKTYKRLWSSNIVQGCWMRMNLYDLNLESEWIVPKRANITANRLWLGSQRLSGSNLGKAPRISTLCFTRAASASNMSTCVKFWGLSKYS